MTRRGGGLLGVDRQKAAEEERKRRAAEKSEALFTALMSGSEGHGEARRLLAEGADINMVLELVDETRTWEESGVSSPLVIVVTVRV
jgi:hypothetical protein